MIKKILVMTFLFGLYAPSAHGMDYVMKSIAPATFFVVGGVAVPGAVVFSLTKNSKEGVGGMSLDTQDIDNKTPAMLKAALSGLLSSLTMLGIGYVLDYKSAKIRNILAVACACGINCYFSWPENVDKGASKLQSMVVDGLVQTLCQIGGGAFLVGAYYYATSSTKK